MKIYRKVINFNKVNQTGGAGLPNTPSPSGRPASISNNQRSLEERVKKLERSVKNNNFIALSANKNLTTLYKYVFNYFDEINYDLPNLK